MTYDYGPITAAASRLIARFGATVTLIKPGEVTGPENNPTVGPATEHEVKAVIADYSALERNGSLIGLTDRKVMVEAGDVVPTQADRLRVGDRTLEVVSVKAIEPGGVAVYYEVQARG